MTRRKTVILAFTKQTHDGCYIHEPTLLRIYSNSHYDDAYNWIADLAARHGNAFRAVKDRVGGSMKLTIWILCILSLTVAVICFMLRYYQATDTAAKAEQQELKQQLDEMNKFMEKRFGVTTAPRTRKQP